MLHYNVFSRILAEIATRYIGIPLLSFFDDFGAPAPSRLAQAALQTFTSFCSLLGIQLAIAKSDYGPRLVFLGLGGYFPRHQNNMKIQVFLSP